MEVNLTTNVELQERFIYVDRRRPVIRYCRTEGRTLVTRKDMSRKYIDIIKEMCEKVITSVRTV